MTEVLTADEQLAIALGLSVRGATPGENGSRRSRKEKNRSESDREELWRLSVAEEQRERHEAITRAWCTYHRRMADNIEKTAAVLAADHRQKAGALEGGLS